MTKFNNCVSPGQFSIISQLNIRLIESFFLLALPDFTGKFGECRIIVRLTRFFPGFLRFELSQKVFFCSPIGG